jgi:hypothetical protein
MAVKSPSETAAATTSSTTTPSGTPSENAVVRNSSKRRADTSQREETKVHHHVPAKKADRILIAAKGELDQCDNKVVSARYTLITFFPLVRSKHLSYDLISLFFCKLVSNGTIL